MPEDPRPSCADRPSGEAELHYPLALDAGEDFTPIEHRLPLNITILEEPADLLAATGDSDFQLSASMVCRAQQPRSHLLFSPPFPALPAADTAEPARPARRCRRSSSSGPALPPPSPQPSPKAARKSSKCFPTRQ